jgi:hypothetical protein
MEPHPYAKFIHSENQDILWGLFKNAKFAERPKNDSSLDTELEAFFKNEIRNYYMSQLISSGKPCNTVRELFEINRDALAHLFSSYSFLVVSPSVGSPPSVSTYEIPIGINVIEEKKRQQEMQQDRFASFSTEYHQMLARPAPKIDAIVNTNAPNDEKIKNMDELLEQQMQARKEDEKRIAALMKPPSNIQEKPKSLKIDYGSEKSVSWDPVVEVVNI